MIRRRVVLAGLAFSACPAVAQIRPRRSVDADIAFPTPGRRAWADQVPQVRIALISGENEADRLGRYGAYRDLMAKTFGVAVRLFPAPDFAGVIQAFAAAQVDLCGASPALYAGAWLETDGGVEPLLVAEQEDGSASYIGVMVTRSDSGITNLADMRGRSLAWADPNSASGFLLPRFALRRAHINPETYFSRTGFAGGHEQAVIAVLQRQYDAATTWASGQGEQEAGYSRGNLRSMVEKGMLDMRDLRVIWQTQPVIYGPLMARKALPEAFKEDMRQFHLALPKTHPTIYRAIERGDGAGYREVTHDQFQLLIDVRREEAANRRRRG